MPRTIWKYTLEPRCAIAMPQGAQLLSVAEQNGDICLWALVDPQATQQTRYFAGFGTGHPIPDAADLTFVGSVLMTGGSMVFHIFEASETCWPIE